MNYKEATGKSIQESFEDYHRLNPIVYSHFKRLAFKAIDAGKKKISFKMIMNVIRWEIYLTVEEPTLFNLDGKLTKFKINDAYGSRYARIFAEEFPEHKNKIELRRLRS